ncbi:MAG: Tat pathway signal protein [Terracidiphilus sp.]
MDRRRFLQSVATSALALPGIVSSGETLPSFSSVGKEGLREFPASEASVEGHTLLSSFSRRGEQWKVYEDLRVRDGAITFVSSAAKARVLSKTAEPVFAETGPQHLGLDLKDIGLTPEDLLAQKLLANGDPDEDTVRGAAPPLDSAFQGGPRYRAGWNTIVGTRECSDTMPVYPGGNTRTYHPVQYFHELMQQHAGKRFEGLVGGWMPAVRKIFPADDGSYYEIVVLGDVLAKDRFIVQTWHRTAHIRDGKILDAVYGYSYAPYTRRRQAPKPEEFYLGLLEFAEYWDRLLHDLVPISLPDASWTDMVAHAFVKEQIVRPGGVYPKYGAVDRDYYGPEYDGFQDIFTMSLYANLECGRFQQAHDVFDNYFSDFVDPKGVINMRGPETAQFGLTLSLVARYYNYTRDQALMRKHRGKIEATAALLQELHEESLQLPSTDPGHGLIHGWCESDSCLMPDPSVWWKPYFANSAFAVRGWRDISAIWRALNFDGVESLAASWSRSSTQLQSTLVESIDAHTRHDMQPTYIAPLPGAKLTFWESLSQEHPSEQQWVHRCYAELLQAGVIPERQANIVIDCMRSYGATTLGIVANVERPHPGGRDILGFISYGYAQVLLRLDRIEEYILFLYSHRYHVHSRGSWTAGEVTGITGDGALFCIPSQLTVPLLVRWMLVFEDPDASRLYFGRALPRKWVAAGKPIAIQDAPTRWGRVSYRFAPRGESHLVASVRLPEKGALPEELQVSFRLPTGRQLSSLTVNGRSVKPAGLHNDAALFPAVGERTFEVVAAMS